MKGFENLFTFLRGALAVAFGMCLGYLLGHQRGWSEGRDETREHFSGGCICGAKRTCAFGVGIVGEQRCEAGYPVDKWTRCEPVKEGAAQW